MTAALPFVLSQNCLPCRQKSTKYGPYQSPVVLLHFTQSVWAPNPFCKYSPRTFRPWETPRFQNSSGEVRITLRPLYAASLGTCSYDKSPCRPQRWQIPGIIRLAIATPPRCLPVTSVRNDTSQGEMARASGPDSVC